MAIKNRVPIYLVELAGLLLVLIAAGWQLFLEDKIKDIAAESNSARIEMKLEYILMAIGDTRGDVNQSSDPEERIKKVLEHYKYYDHFKGLDSMGKMAANDYKKLSTFRAILYLMGSMLLIIGRYIELSRTQSSTKSPEITPNKANSADAKSRAAD